MRKLKLSLALCLIPLVSPAVYADARLGACSQLFFKGFAPIVSNKKLNKNLFPLCYQKFAVNYSGVSKTPLWSAELVTPEDLVKAKEVKREEAFHEDERIPSNFRARLTDYRGSGWDRGHMVPSATRSTRTDQTQSFSLSNIVPQAKNNNQEAWRNIEEATRTIITKFQQPAFMITGPLYLSPKIRRLGSGVYVPSHIYKVVYYPNLNVMSAYVSVNDDYARTEVVSVAELQRASGLVFFPSLQGSKILSQRYALPLSSKAAYRLKSIDLDASYSVGIFEYMPDESAMPAPKKIERSPKNEVSGYVRSQLKNRAKEEIKSLSLVY